LAGAIGKVLVDPDSARRVARRAARIVGRDYTWSAVGTQTVAVYERAAGFSVR
jgi:glycosyltransferase involved in cell wall biosynthesis